MFLDKAQDTAWYEHWFDREEYELVYRRRNEAEGAQLIDLIEDVMAPRPGASVLDVACGRGRHARQLARRGYRVTGLDLSERALETARERARAEDLEIDFVQGDMRHMAFDRPFDGAVNLFTSFGYFESDREHAQVIDNVAAALNASGWFVQDFLNVDHIRDNLIPYDRRQENGLQIEQERWIHRNRLNKRIKLTRGGDTRTFRESVRLLTYDDFESMYESAGLEIIDTSGSYDGQPFDTDSPRLILFSRTR